ncbi:peptidase E [[Actinobacillus] rossii]|uniref:Peptidase E n=1 Tax=[Actinobacillus] rossii TaxID=123820 RepID=A0A380TNA3_9PAST|nr:peptidase E [[Actinobacillus] rossii]
MKNMLLMSGSKYQETGYLAHTIPWLCLAGGNCVTDPR